MIVFFGELVARNTLHWLLQSDFMLTRHASENVHLRVDAEGKLPSSLVGASFWHCRACVRSVIHDRRAGA